VNHRPTISSSRLLAVAADHGAKNCEYYLLGVFEFLKIIVIQNISGKNDCGFEMNETGTLSGGCCGRNGKKHLTNCQCALPDCEPSGGKPRLSLLDEALFNHSEEGAFTTDRDKQSFLACWVVPDRDSRSRIFRDFVARGAGRRGIDSHLDWLDDVKAPR
jgi:hypothetical protein